MVPFTLTVSAEATFAPAPPSDPTPSISSAIGVGATRSMPPLYTEYESVGAVSSRISFLPSGLFTLTVCANAVPAHATAAAAESRILLIFYLLFGVQWN